MNTVTAYATGNTRLTGQHVDYATLDARDDDKITVRVPRRTHEAMGQPRSVTVTVAPTDKSLRDLVAEYVTDPANMPLGQNLGALIDGLTQHIASGGGNVHD